MTLSYENLILDRLQLTAAALQDESRLPALCILENIQGDAQGILSP
jgi:hypothetical protein